MNLLFRFLWVILTGLHKPRLTPPFGESILSFRVLPNDLDLNWHMNNGRYLSIMDLGRMDLLARMGMGRVALQRKWYPLVGSAMMRFLKPLEPMTRYQLKSRILCWDEKWFYIEHRIEQEGSLRAIGIIKGLLRARTGNIRPAEIVEAVNVQAESPPVPEFIRRWQEGEEGMTTSGSSPFSPARGAR